MKNWFPTLALVTSVSIGCLALKIFWTSCWGLKRENREDNYLSPGRVSGPNNRNMLPKNAITAKPPTHKSLLNHILFILLCTWIPMWFIPIMKMYHTDGLLKLQKHTVRKHEEEEIWSLNTADMSIWTQQRMQLKLFSEIIKLLIVFSINQ